MRARHTAHTAPLLALVIGPSLSSRLHHQTRSAPILLAVAGYSVTPYTLLSIFTSDSGRFFFECNYKTRKFISIYSVSRATFLNKEIHLSVAPSLCANLSLFDQNPLVAFEITSSGGKIIPMVLNQERKVASVFFVRSATLIHLFEGLLFKRLYSIYHVISEQALVWFIKEFMMIGILMSFVLWQF